MLRRSLITFLIATSLVLGLTVLAPPQPQAEAWLPRTDGAVELEAEGWLAWFRSLFFVSTVSAPSCNAEDHCAADACTPEFCTCSSEPCDENACNPEQCSNGDGGDDGGGSVFDPGG